MKIIAALDADLETTWLGLASRAGERVGDDTVLAMTVRRLALCKRLHGVYVLVPPEQSARATELLAGTPALVRQHEAGTAPHIPLVRVARKWSLDGWRGGIGGSSSLDEYTHPRVLAGLVRQESADAVLCVPAAAPLIDPEVADAMIEHFCTVSDEMRMTFTPAPPGLTGTIFQAEILQEMAEKNIPPGWTMSYKPDSPSIDLTMRKCCFQAPEALRHATGRMIADTRASLERVRRCLADHPDPDAETVGRWLIAQETEYVPELPREVEIELTTEDQLKATTLRPRGACVGRRGPLDVSVVQRIAAELADYDDSLVVLGGFGEPLLHPKFDEVLGVLRDAGILGIALRTNGLALTDEMIETIIHHQVDVVSVTLDAVSSETYAAVHGSDSFETVLGNIERLVAVREKRVADFSPRRYSITDPSRSPTVAPLVIPEMTKCRETLPEMDAFFDGWIRKVGWAVLVGYNHYGGRLTDRSVVDMTPPSRTTCRRIRTRCLITADAHVLRCDQDFSAEHPVGNLGEATLGDLWRGSAFSAFREAHARGEYADTPLCQQCQEWHRP